MAAITVTKVCPRKLYLQQNLNAGASKHRALRRILTRALKSIDITVRQDIDKIVRDVFADEPNLYMLSVEAEKEAKHMTALLKRWHDYELQCNGGILAKDIRHTVPFAGETRTQWCHYLVDRGDKLQAIRFKLKAPEYTYAGRSTGTRPEWSEDLLMLQRCGEAEAKLRGIDKPVFAAFYYLKSKNDKAQELAAYFEQRRGANIIEYHFDDAQAKVVEDNSVSADLSQTCAAEDCKDCRYNDLCNLSMEKRRLVELPPVALKSIDEISLTPAQLELINFEAGECRVNAVAGSGKTTVIALRTLALLEAGVAPETILMVTFTEKAKREMRQRMKSFADGKIMQGTNLDVDRVEVETFNSWGQHILDHHYAALGFTEAPKLIEDVEKKDIIIELLERYSDLPMDYRNPFLSLGKAEGAVVQMGKLIDALKAAHAQTEEDVQSVLAPVMAEKAAEILAIYRSYNDILLSRNRIDYEDQLRLLLQLKDMGVFEKMGYEHLIVDEFQDSNPNQIGIIVELRKRCKTVRSLVVVGDELQAIYGFRNATPDNLVSFADYFPNMIDIDMTENFRSQQPIIALANMIVDKISRLRKIIIAHRNETKVQPAVMEVENPKKEISLYTRQIKKLIEKDGVAPNTIAVLCRTRAELVAQKEALDAAGIPCMMKVPEIVADADHVKAILAFTAFLRDNNDTESLALFLRSLGETPSDAVAAAVNGSAAMAITKAFEQCENEVERINAFFEFIAPLEEDYIAAYFIEKLKAMQFGSLQQILTYCGKYQDYGVKETCSTAREETDCVSLITIHSAKGLEWDTVLLSLKKFPVDEESRRLFYVGLTRAKERLLITYTMKQKLLADLLAA